MQLLFYQMIRNFVEAHFEKLLERVINQHLIPYAHQNFYQSLQASKNPFVEGPFFIAWFLFNKTFHKQTIAQQYLNESTTLTPEEQRFINLLNQTYYSFYLVLESSSSFVVLKDIFLGTLHKVKNQCDSLQKGDIAFNRLVLFNGLYFSVGMAPIIIHPYYHDALLRFKNSLGTLTPKKLKKTTALFDYFLTLAPKILNPIIRVTNSDGDLVEYTTTYFKNDLSPKKVREILHPIIKKNNWTQKGKEHWGHPICLGKIFIKKTHLILETNSLKRAEQGKNLIQDYGFPFEKMLIESSPKIDEIPTMKIVVEDVIKINSWKKWVHTPSPTFDNKTPKEISLHKEGRERLEAFLSLYEYDDSKINTTAIRKELGLE